MKSLKSIASLVLTALIGISSLATWPVAAQNTEVARPRSLVDHTRTDRLTGVPRRQDDPFYCPPGQVNSGGACVLISNQSAGTRSWTSYFLNQTKCGYGCATILSDGRIKLWNGTSVDGVYEVPLLFSSLSISANCSREGVYAGPVFTNDNKLNGSGPSDWSFNGKVGGDCF